MSFFNECSYILRKSNKDMIFLSSNLELTYNYFLDSEVSLLCNKLTNFPIDFTSYYFDIDEDDNIYGIFNDESIHIVGFDYCSNKFSTLNKIEYDFKNFTLDFPYIKFIDDDIHIIYYLTSKSSSTTVLFHHYRHNNKWFENKIDFINIPILDNFKVFFNNNTPIIFYLKDIDGIPQVLTSMFNVSTCMWNNPIQLTYSMSNKIYLSVISDHLNFYHISFSENISSAYAIRYINGYLNPDSFQVNISKIVTDPGDCSFPTIIKFKDIVYLMWVQNRFLYTSLSNDLGMSWSDFLEDDFSTKNQFIRCFINSNYHHDLEYNCSSLFISKSDISILGFSDK